MLGLIAVLAVFMLIPAAITGLVVYLTKSGEASNINQVKTTRVDDFTSNTHSIPPRALLNKITFALISALLVIALFSIITFVAVAAFPYGYTLVNNILGSSILLQSLYKLFLLFGLVSWLVLFLMAVGRAFQKKINIGLIKIGIFFGVLASISLALVHLAVIPIIFTWLYAINLYSYHAKKS